MERKKQHLRIERQHPRMQTEILCVVGLAGKEPSEGRVRNLSEGGLKFSCGRQTIYRLLPENRRTPGLVSDIQVEIHFELPQPGQAALTVKCQACLIHFERLAQDDFHVGIEFIKMDKTTLAGLQAYLQPGSAPPDPGEI